MKLGIIGLLAFLFSTLTLANDYNCSVSYNGQFLENIEVEKIAPRRVEFPEVNKTVFITINKVDYESAFQKVSISFLDINAEESERSTTILTLNNQETLHLITVFSKNIFALNCKLQNK